MSKKTNDSSLPTPAGLASADPPAAHATPANYSEAVQQLEQLIVGLESGQLPLEDLLAHYQRGSELLSYCRDRLQAVEDQVRLLEDGVAKPWSPE